jgi:hypothetical protein
MTARGLASTQTSRIKALQEKHAIISSQIEEAQSSPSATDFYLRQLKKQRLILKDELEATRKKATH